MRLLRCGFSFMLLLSIPVLADSALSQSSAVIFQQLSTMASHQGVFKQTKQLKGISFPLVSEGEFAYLKNIGLYNRVDKPLFQAVSYTRDGIVEWNQRSEEIANQSNDVVGRYVGEMLLAFFEGRQALIEERFSVKAEALDAEKPQLWALQMTPKDKVVADYIATIRLQGDDYIRAIEILSATGDKTHIDFSDFAALAADHGFCRFFPAASQQACLAL